MQIDDDLGLPPLGPVAPLAAAVAVAMAPVAAASTIGTAAHLTIRSFDGLCPNCFGAGHSLTNCASPLLNLVDDPIASSAALNAHLGVLTELLVMNDLRLLAKPPKADGATARIHW